MSTAVAVCPLAGEWARQQGVRRGRQARVAAVGGEGGLASQQPLGWPRAMKQLMALKARLNKVADTDDMTAGM